MIKNNLIRVEMERFSLITLQYNAVIGTISVTNNDKKYTVNR